MEQPPKNGFHENNVMYRELRELEKKVNRLETKLEVQEEKLVQFSRDLAEVEDNTKWIRRTFVALISTGAVSVPASVVVGLL